MAPTLRASCDACNLAKVKCTKTRPCSRCKKHSFECIYGISLRSGRRASLHQQYPRHERRQQEDIAPKPEVVQASHFKDYWTWDLPASSAPYPLEMDMSPFMFHYAMSCPVDEKILGEESFPFPETTSGDSHLKYIPPESSLSPALSSSALSCSTGSTAMTSPGPSSCLQLSSFVPACNCFQTTVKTLSTMQQLADSAHTAFDVALNHGKEAVAFCTSTLRCRCAGESSLILLVGFLIAKIISVYERPCGAWKPVEQNFPSREATSGMDGRLRLGSYSVDESDEERLKTEIVKLELGKAEILIAHFRDRVSQSIQGPERTVGEALVVLLSERFRTAYDRGNIIEKGR